MARVTPMGIARSLQRRARTLRSLGYSHPPVGQDEDASFRILVDGRTIEVRVREVSIQEQLDEARRAAEALATATDEDPDHA